MNNTPIEVPALARRPICLGNKVATATVIAEVIGIGLTVFANNIEAATEPAVHNAHANASA